MKYATKKKASKKKTEGESAGRRGRVSAYAGTFVYKKKDEVPFREGSVNDISFKAIKNGMAYEKFLEAGGTRKSLADMIRDGYVRVAKTKAEAA